LRQGFVTDLGAYSVVNSQLTAFRRDLAPAAVQFYGEQQRNTDIFAALVMRRVAKQWGWYTHYGQPLAYHNRSIRDLKRDYEAERWGMSNISAFADELARWDVNGVDFSYLLSSKVLSDRYKQMLQLWLQDCKEAMGEQGLH
jgi:hypothetical protein